jgi:hypothetical protein
VSFLLFSPGWVAGALALYTRMREMLGSNLSCNIVYPDIQWFYSALPGECSDVTTIKRQVPSRFSSVHHSFIHYVRMNNSRSVNEKLFEYFKISLEYLI